MVGPYPDRRPPSHAWAAARVAFGSWSRSFRRWAGTIHAALPGRSRHPLRVLDQRAMELASQDAELRAALFRFVDVTPACRSLDDLARHLTGYLEEVDERPPPIEAAMRMSGTRPGRAALGRGRGGRRAPHGAPLHRRRDRRSAALKAIRHLWDNGAAVSLDLLGEATVTEPEADRYAARCMEALETLGEAAPVVAGAAGARGGLARAAAAREPVREGVRAHAAAAARGARGRARGRRARACARCSQRAKELGAHLHIDMESVDTVEATLGLVFELLDDPELRDGPSVGSRDPGLPARVARPARAGARVGAGQRARSSRSWSGS